MKSEIYYYIINGGDGSANLKLVETMELAEYLDEQEDEGWGESSSGVINDESEILSKEQVLIDHISDEDDYDNFVKKFFTKRISYSEQLEGKYDFYTYFEVNNSLVKCYGPGTGMYEHLIQEIDKINQKYFNEEAY